MLVDCRTPDGPMGRVKRPLLCLFFSSFRQLGICCQAGDRDDAETLLFGKPRRSLEVARPGLRPEFRNNQSARAMYCNSR